MERLDNDMFVHSSPRTPACAVVSFCRKLAPSANLDASARSVEVEFLPDGQERPEWVVSSPSCEGAIFVSKAAASTAENGVALELPLFFLESCADRGTWL